ALAGRVRLLVAEGELALLDLALDGRAAGVTVDALQAVARRVEAQPAEGGVPDADEGGALGGLAAAGRAVGGGTTSRRVPPGGPDDGEDDRERAGHGRGSGRGFGRTPIIAEPADEATVSGGQ